MLKTQSLEWFYNNVRKRFKRFGSAKVLRTLYRKHPLEHGALSEQTGNVKSETPHSSFAESGSFEGGDMQAAWLEATLLTEAWLQPEPSLGMALHPAARAHLLWDRRRVYGRP